jgi:hypothetical protein
MWEISIIISVLGTCFFLVYLATTLQGDDKFIQPMKIFLMLVALFLMIINSSLPNAIIDATNETTADLTNTTVINLHNHINTNMSILLYTISFFMSIFILYYVYSVLMQHREKKRLEKENE